MAESIKASSQKVSPMMIILAIHLSLTKPFCTVLFNTFCAED